jgi:hypothetical protein
MNDCVRVVASSQSSSKWDWTTQFAVIYNHLSISIDLDWNIQAKVALFIRCPAAMEKHFHHWAVEVTFLTPPLNFDQSDHTRPSLRHHWSIYVDQFGYDATNSGEIIHRRRRSSLAAARSWEFDLFLLLPLQLECFYPAGLICFLHSDLCGNLWEIGVGIHPAKMSHQSGLWRGELKFLRISYLISSTSLQHYITTQCRRSTLS